MRQNLTNIAANVGDGDSRTYGLPVCGVIGELNDTSQSDVPWS